VNKTHQRVRAPVARLLLNTHCAHHGHDTPQTAQHPSWGIIMSRTSLLRSSPTSLQSAQQRGSSGTTMLPLLGVRYAT
jgi:hypothetical protein